MVFSASGVKVRCVILSRMDRMPVLEGQIYNFFCQNGRCAAIASGLASASGSGRLQVLLIFSGGKAPACG
jgi:hypothetical protein